MPSALPPGTEASLHTPSTPECGPESTRHVSELLDDLRVLIEHLANWPEKVGPAQATDPYAPSALEAPAQLLVRDPDAIATDPALLGQLYTSIAALTRLAAPADVASIRLTRALVQGERSIEVPANIAREARRLRRWAWASASFGLVTFLVTVLLLVHVDRGRRIIQQLQAVRGASDAAMSDVSVARTASTAAGAAPLDCSGLDVDKAGIVPTEHSEPEGPVLCARLRDATFRTRLVYRELRIWNLTSARLSYISPITWIVPDPALPSDLPRQEWESAELRTSLLMTAMTGFVLPMLLGLLGACVYVYREIDDAIRTATLAAREGLHGTLRMLLGAILGGLLGALWTSGDVVRLEGVSLSLGALAFFIGFSVEVVFRLVDALVRSVADRIGKPRA